ncbi:hypothetical protein NDU88_002026 [Pleurodeles waltl]|uniref:Uncharacterized protein n=1 Tax=Pleurodeles waltl TaxID=8319 RepID=A0AAV7TKN0_PLEWA|nr:hypothetical protein NDU88_002026 [Pleurodeles waltl]
MMARDLNIDGAPNRPVGYRWDLGPLNSRRVMIREDDTMQRHSTETPEMALDDGTLPPEIGAEVEAPGPTLDIVPGWPRGFIALFPILGGYFLTFSFVANFEA